MVIMDLLHAAKQEHNNCIAMRNCEGYPQLGDAHLCCGASLWINFYGNSVIIIIIRWDMQVILQS
jgi:hypothetical protein